LGVNGIRQNLPGFYRLTNTIGRKAEEKLSSRQLIFFGLGVVADKGLPTQTLGFQGKEMRKRRRMGKRRDRCGRGVVWGEAWEEDVGH